MGNQRRTTSPAGKIGVGVSAPPWGNGYVIRAEGHLCHGQKIGQRIAPLADGWKMQKHRSRQKGRQKHGKDPEKPPVFFRHPQLIHRDPVGGRGKGLRLYVDGSFVPSCPFAGWAVVAVRNGEKLWTMSGRTERPAESRNVDGEVEAATRAIRWLRENPQRAEIVHDYEGVARWALGEWKAKSAVARRYAADAAPLPEGLSFRHVVAHAGEVWNETADSLARGALRPGEGSGADEGRASSAGTK